MILGTKSINISTNIINFTVASKNKYQNRYYQYCYLGVLVVIRLFLQYRLELDIGMDSYLRLDYHIIVDISTIGMILG